jgi:16S rRNA (uracil1498-N3)-methyltransferase
MVLPLFSIPANVILSAGDVYNLDGPEGKHAAQVRRMRAGEGIQLTNGLGFRATGLVAEVSTNSLRVSVNDVETEELPKLRITLVQALAKGDRDELAVQAATELGALTVIPWQATRSISKWEGDKAEKSRVRWQSIASEAAKQSLRVWNPEVLPVASSKQLPALLADYDHVIVLEPSAGKSITELGKLSGQVALIVGPEGGIDASELTRFEEAKFQIVRMGEGVLRTSTAGLAAIAYLAGSNGLWG